MGYGSSLALMVKMPYKCHDCVRSRKWYSERKRLWWPVKQQFIQNGKWPKHLHAVLFSQNRILNIIVLLKVGLKVITTLHCTANQRPFYIIIFCTDELLMNPFWQLSYWSSLSDSWLINWVWLRLNVFSDSAVIANPCWLLQKSWNPDFLKFV